MADRESLGAALGADGRPEMPVQQSIPNLHCATTPIYKYIILCAGESHLKMHTCECVGPDWALIRLLPGSRSRVSRSAAF